MKNTIRIFSPDGSHHLMNRGNRQATIFRDDDDCYRFVGLIREAKKKFGFKLHKAVLIPNHYHLKATSPEEDTLSRVFMKIDKEYSVYFNKKHDLTGRTWQGPFKAFHVNTEAYDLACGLYIETNPIRAGLVDDPADYKWSSCGFYLKGGGMFGDLIDPDDSFLSLGDDDPERRLAYRILLDSYMKNPPSREEAKKQFRGMAKKK